MNPPGAVANSTSTETARQTIRAAILSGEFSPGMRLREAELAERTGVSRTPVREALRLLESEGLITFEPHRGARVSTQSAQELYDLFELRALLEGHAAAVAAQRIQADELAHLDELAARMAELLDQPDTSDEMTTLNGEFHRSIANAARVDHLSTVVPTLMHVPLILRTFRVYSADRLRSSVQQHLELTQALRHRDADWARSVMSAHILAARAQIQPPPTIADDPTVSV